MKTVGIITIHAISNFGSLLQTFATQKMVERLGYKAIVINYKYPNDYHAKEYQKKSPYAPSKQSFAMRLKLALYARTCMKKNSVRKSELFKQERERLLFETKVYPTKESLHDNPPKFDIYFTGSDQVWNPRYMRGDYTFFLDFIDNVPKVAFSASFGTTVLTDSQKQKMRPLLNQYSAISLREPSGVGLVNDICNKKSEWTCDPTLLLSGDDWSEIFDDLPMIKGEYILCYILTYTANPYPYATRLIKHIQKHLNKKVVILDETGRYWLDYRYKSFRSYGPREIVNLFKNASFIISSSFHGAAFSINFKKDFYSLFPIGVKDERQESLLKLVGAEARFIHVGDPLPALSTLKITNWDSISEKLNAYRQHSINYLKSALSDAAKLTE